MKPATVLVVASLMTLVQGCATVPKEAVDLSATVGRDLEAVHRAHVALLNGYFDRMEGDINAFVDSQYRPYCIERNMEDFGLIQKLKAQVPGVDPLDVMEVFVEEVVADIEDFRTTLLDPVRAQRSDVHGAIEEAYRRMQDAQAVVTGHLASVRRVHDLHDEMLAKADMEGLRDTFVNTTVKASESIAKLTERTRFTSGKLDDFRKKLDELKKTTGSIRK
jgi:hypothetical protein